MANIKLHLKSGKREITLEGEKTDVDALMDKWWAAPSPADDHEDDLGEEEEVDSGSGGAAAAAKPAKPAKKRVRRAPQSGSEGTPSRPVYDSNAFANAVKEDNRFARIQSKIILGDSTLYDKVAFVCWWTKEAMTSGEIQKCLTALDIKVALPRVSEVFKQKSSNFTFSGQRVKGAVLRYKLTAAAAHDFDQWFNSDA